MIYFLSFIILFLLGIIYLQSRSKRERKASLEYISQKLNSIMDKGTDERLLLQTENDELKSLLTALNRLLDHHQKAAASYNKTETSVRKMLSNITHDLKTPLTVVLGYVEMMLHDPDLSKEERERLLEKVQGKTMEILGLMKKFFDLAKLESGDHEIPLSRVDLNEACKRNILSFYELLTSRGFEAVIEIPDKSIYSMGNEECLDRILNNLISNATQYGSEGKVVGLTVREDEKYAYIDVWDKGKGISELHKDLVFERMYTLEDSRNKLYQGSGLGLTITKRLVEKIGGEILLNSIPYEKTTFTIKLLKLIY
ncbi:sensor histidine kinase [Bacillus songklensis]|uniref:histidine kinase n=1 Tax=Bacillus songklensis TaxID=1069116 RepID=A0ABV8B816_9BACI